MPLRHPVKLHSPATRNRMHRVRWGLVGLFSVVLVFLAGWRWLPLDRTRGLPAADVAQAAGRAVLAAPGYRFEMSLTGAPGEMRIPSSRMQGVYQRTPELMHLSGRTSTGHTEVSLEYYLEGSDLYMRDPRDNSWMLLRHPNVETLRPDDLAVPLVRGLRSAAVIGHERLEGGEAVVLRLELDPHLMQRRLNGARPDQVQYKLWVYVRTLKPARMTIQHVPGLNATVAAYTYELNWHPGRAPRIAVPPEVKAGAREVISP